MLKILKKIILIFIIIVVLITILLIFEKIILPDKIFLADYDKDWIIEDDKINLMNSIKIDIPYLENNKIVDNKIIWKYIDEGKLKDKGEKKRIVIIGDSFIWGNGYDNANHIWWQQLRNLILYNGYENVEVVAAGFNGLNTKLELENILKNEIVMNELDPDIVIVGFVDNDIEVLGEKNIYDENNLVIQFFREYFPNIYDASIKVIINKYGKEEKFIKKYGYLFDMFDTETASESNMKRFEKEVIVPLSEYIEDAEYPVIFVTTPILTFTDSYGKMFETIEEVFKKNNIKFYNNLEEFSINFPEATIKDMCINKVNLHPSVEACKFFAQYTMNLLENDYRYILGTKSEEIELDLEINDAMPYDILNKKYEFNFDKETNLYTKKYEITYPNEETLKLPINENYIKLNLKYDINIKNIKIECNEGIEKLELYTNQVNKELGYDDKVLKLQENKKGDFEWQLNENDMITSINLAAKIKNNLPNEMKLIISYEKRRIESK